VAKNRPFSLTCCQIVVLMLPHRNVFAGRLDEGLVASAPYWTFQLIDAAAINTDGYALLPNTPFLNLFRFIESEKIRI